jgi:hypothetical protein
MPFTGNDLSFRGSFILQWKTPALYEFISRNVGDFLSRLKG